MNHKIIYSIILIIILLGKNTFSQESENDTLDKQNEKDLLYGSNLDEEYHFSIKLLIKNNNLIKQSIEESKNEQTNIIIVNKAEYTIYLIEKGKCIFKFPVELGADPYNDKSYEGDLSTPEGIYKIRKKLNENQSSYYKAFLLNYPNKSDLKKGKTGSLIEIHGYGTGKRPNEGGENWTAGCIALSNKNMDKIYPYINVGDKVVIVKYSNYFIELGI